VQYTALVCINTCNRARYLRRYLPHFAPFAAQDARFSLLVSLDGSDPETVEFCAEWGVPLLHSEQREGVGISKNRAFERFPDFDYYFFIEDDVELLDAALFPTLVEISDASGIHHFSLFERAGLRQITGESFAAGHQVVHGMFGGADLNFFTGIGLRQVGGWHTLFAEFGCGGHTEHSYRFFRAGLAPAPFNVPVELTDMCLWHAPPSVVRHDVAPINADQILVPERELIDQQLVTFPLKTLSPYQLTTTDLAGPIRLASVVDGRERYPLVHGAELREARSGYHLGRYGNSNSRRSRALALMAAARYWPTNPELRHAVKVALRPEG